MTDIASCVVSNNFGCLHWIDLSRHTVVCQWPGKTRSTQVCYLQELLSHCFHHLMHLVHRGQLKSYYVSEYLSDSIFTTSYGSMEDGHMT